MPLTPIDDAVFAALDAMRAEWERTFPEGKLPDEVTAHMIAGRRLFYKLRAQHCVRETVREGVMKHA